MDGLEVVIIGAGMGGLTAGLAMRQAGYHVRIYDRAPRFLDVGAGISLWSNGVRVLDRLGLGRQIAAIGGRMERVAYRFRDGAPLTDFSLEPLIAAVGERPYPVARADLQHMLLAALGERTVELGAECVGVELDASSATAVFADGRRATADVIVAADGTRSILRDVVLAAPLPRRRVGYVNWNGLVPMSAALGPEQTWLTFVGEHKRASLMPVGGQRFYFFFDVPLAEGTPPEPVQAELRRHFAGWAEPVQALIAALDPARTNRIELSDFDPPPRLVKERLVLLGDAAHTSPPDLGQGGCQAMEDAWVLAHQLLTTNIGVSDALARYEALRLPRVTEIVQRARKRAHMTHGTDPEQTEAWYRELARETGAGIIAGLAKTIAGAPL